MVEGSSTRAAEMAKKFLAVNRWAVTGTPIQKAVNGKSQYWKIEVYMKAMLESVAIIENEDIFNWNFKYKTKRIIQNIAK